MHPPLSVGLAPPRGGAHPAPVPALTAALPPCLAQVTNQADGSSLLITLESKAQAKVAAAATRMRELLPPGCILSEERDVAVLGSSKRRSAEMMRRPQQ
jgi:hypothetical protein